ncbi:MAG: tetraacyldisaccharide 4'-kinase [Chitinophagaceae bacterium]|nr:tetraacyldisaccharide 4'-kinase [Chitinophagaceae bacterium]
MFSNFFLKSFRILLLPFSLLYLAGIWVRNKMFDKNILKSSGFGIPLICVGNLSVGGTGKSPMVEYLVTLLKGKYRVATLSRGYKRKTKGYALAGKTTTALEIGDEPMQFHLKFPDVPVAVGEERIEAIPQLLHDRPETEAIILDDAFQHRTVKAGLNILLTDYNNLFTRDFYLPTGDLRDLKSSYKRAEIIVVTKCRKDLDEAEKQKLIKEINPQPGQHIFFTAIEYSRAYHILTKEERRVDKEAEVLLVTGIANPKPLKKLLEENSYAYHMLPYADHHIFTIDDLRDITKEFEKIKSKNKVILTTEKDAVRLVKFSEELMHLPVYVVPVSHRFLSNEEEQFYKLVTDFINNFKKE